MHRGTLNGWKSFCVFVFLVPAGAQADYEPPFQAKGEIELVPLRGKPQASNPPCFHALVKSDLMVDSAKESLASSTLSSAGAKPPIQPELGDSKHPNLDSILGRGTLRFTYPRTVDGVEYETYEIPFSHTNGVKYRNSIHELWIHHLMEKWRMQITKEAAKIPFYVIEYYDTLENSENGSFFPLFEVPKFARLDKFILSTSFQWHRYRVFAVARLCQTIMTLHANKMVHRDIQPSTILPIKLGRTFDQQMVLKLVDFGLAYQYGEDFTRTQFFLPDARNIPFSHPRFLTAVEVLRNSRSSEQITRFIRDKINDRWGFGATLLYLILRRDPQWIAHLKKDTKSAEASDLILSSLSQKQVDDEIQMAEKTLAVWSPQITDLLVKLLRASLEVDIAAQIKNRTADRFADACEALGG